MGLGQKRIFRLGYFLAVLGILLLTTQGVSARDAGQQDALFPPLLDSDYLEKAVDASLSTAGSTLTYSLLVKNPQSTPLQAMTITDQYDPRLENLRLVSEPVGITRLEASTNTLIIENLALAAGESVLVMVQAEVSAQAVPGDVITTAATLELSNHPVHVSNETRTTIIPSRLPATGEVSRFSWLLWKLIPLVLLLSVGGFVWISLRTHARLRGRLIR